MAAHLQTNGDQGGFTFTPGYPQTSLRYSVLATDRLAASFALRYEVYCSERRLLTREMYPLKLETDHFDEGSIHVGGTDENGLMRGTIRLVRQSPLGLPLFEHCEIYPEFRHLLGEQISRTNAEVSRLAITKALGPKPQMSAVVSDSNNTICVKNLYASPDPHKSAEDFKHAKADIVLGLYKTIYQVSKREGITHWFAAMEKSLVRLMRRFHFEFTPIGPEVDYYGPVIPYIVALSTIEEALFRRCPETFAEFMKGLEPELVPSF